MARIKNIPSARKPRTVQAQKEKQPQPEGLTRTRWKAVIELGASHAEASIKKPNGEWEVVRWAKGSGAGSLGGAEAIPTMAAVKREDHAKEMRHGHAAMRARMIHSTSWEMFSHLKLAFVADAPTPAIAQALSRQEESAAALGLTIEEVAAAFFAHVLQNVIDRCHGPFELYFNITDTWSNRKAQDLVERFQRLAPKAKIYSIDECFASLVGCVGSSSSEDSAQGLYLVIDCGASTMNLGCAEISAVEPRFRIHEYRTRDTGAGAINIAVENEVRRINRVNGVANVEQNAWEVSDYIDEFWKPEADMSISSRAGYEEDEWKSILQCAEQANAKLDSDRMKLISDALTEALRSQSSSTRILLTGRGTLSKTFLSSLNGMLDQDFPDVEIHSVKLDHGTVVLAGLRYLADKAEVMNITAVPVSLWLRSDPDEEDVAASNEPVTVVRICKQGDDLTGASIAGSKRHPLHPIHYELRCGKTEMPTLDLSVYGTPKGINDDDLIRGTNEDLFAFANAADLAAYGQFESQLPIPAGPKREESLHVYVYFLFDRMSVTLDAVFAIDGHQIRALERTSSKDVLKDDGMSIPWRTHKKVEMRRVHLWQVARPELLGLEATQSPRSTQKSQTNGKLSRQAMQRGRKRKRHVEDSPEVIEEESTASYNDERSGQSSPEL